MSFLSEQGTLALASRLKALSDRSYDLVDQIYREHGIALQARWFPVLRLLQQRGPMAVGDIAQGRVQCDGGQLPPEQGVFPLFAQAQGHRGGAAQAQEGDFVNAGQQGVEIAEMRQQDGCGLRADAADARNVVHRIAGQGEVVGDLPRLHAMPRLHAGHAPALVACVVPLLVVIQQQLRQVLVGGDDHAAVAGAVRVQGAADEVIGFVIVVAHDRQPERGAQRLAVDELAPQFLRRRIAVGLVGRVQAIAVAAVQRLVEGDGDVLRALALQQFQQEPGKAVHRVGRPAVGVLELVRHRMPGAEHVQAGVDQVQRPRRKRLRHRASSP